MKTALLLLMGILTGPFVFAQNREARSAIRKGNTLYRAEKYDSAKMSYEQGLKEAPASFNARFNLGDALYQKKDYENARKAFNAGLQATKDKALQSKAYHNIGNTFMKQEKWEEAANAFKNALKLNDKDGASKYNLAYAQAMLKKQQQNKKNNKNKKDQNKKDQKKNKDQQNKDQQHKDQNKKDKDKKDQQNKDNQDKDKKDKEQKDKQQQGDKEKQEQSRHPQPMPSKLSKQEADNLLNALNQEEKQLHDKKKQEKGVPVKLDKDW